MKKDIQIERFRGNPLIVPDQNRSWMSLDVFNCGVIKDKDGLYKMLFRAAGTENQSKSDIGLALSKDGVEWSWLDKPVLEYRFYKPYCTRGIEDPRIVRWINGWNYIFATACSLAGGRVGIWRTKNFLKYEWVGIPVDWEDKNAAIFPEPIGDQAWLLHRKAPHIWISRTKDMTLKQGWTGHRILVKKNKFYRSPNTGHLPNKIGIAGPPVKTAKGWLVITHVVHRKRENMFNRVYSLSFMVLDLKKPTKVLYIHDKPILWPEKDYEIVGRVPVVVFSCATVDTGGDAFYIYWGGADTVICGGRLMKKDLKGICY